MSAPCEAHAVRAKAVAHGRVQGVFYRDTMRRAAERLELSGSAVNKPDGTVESFFEGPRESVERMIEIARQGSSGAEVERLEIEWLEPTGETGFRTG